MTKEKKQVIGKREPLSDDDKDVMMQMLLRNKHAFLRAKDSLTHEHFGEDDGLHSVIWTAVWDFYEQYDDLPARKIIQRDAIRLIKEDPNLLGEDGEDDIKRFLSRAFSPNWGDGVETNEKWAAWTIDTLQKFMEEEVARRLQDALVGKGRITENLPGILELATAEASRIASIADSGGGQLFPVGWDISGGINMFSSGLPFLDKIYNGGMAPGEVYGILGPYGSCKTTLAVMLGVEAARRAYRARISEDWDGRWGLSFLFSYEARLENELRIRMLSYVANVLRTSLESMGKDGMKLLSTSKKPESLKDYEKKKYKSTASLGVAPSAKVIKGELERVQAAIKWLEEHFVVVDMTGFDPHRRRAGGGGIPEIARIIEAELRRLRSEGKDPYVIHVGIDYVGAMARRLMESTGKDESLLRHVISGAPLQAKHQVADHFNCATTMFHQLSGKANERSSRSAMHHTDSAESKNFAENLDFCTCIGTPTKEALCRFEGTKHRRAPAKAALIIRIIGERNAVKLEDKYACDPSDGSIRPISEITGQSTSKEVKKQANTAAKTQKQGVVGPEQTDPESTHEDQIPK